MYGTNDSGRCCGISAYIAESDEEPGNGEADLPSEKRMYTRSRKGEEAENVWGHEHIWDRER